MTGVARIIAAYARQFGVDPRAAMAIANVEGGLHYGAVGDSGSSYGPFQLHVGGALPPGRTAAWANSPAGIRYAISRMASSGARGLTGRAAVAAISSRFERPADVQGEIARAMTWYSQHGGPLPTGRLPLPGAGGRPQGPGSGSPTQGGVDPRQMAFQMLTNFAQSGSTVGVQGMAPSPFSGLLSMVQAAQGDQTHAPAFMPHEHGPAGPVSGRIGAPLPSMVLTSGYGPRVGVVSGESFHYGVDLSAPTGTPIHAMEPGKVIVAGMYGSGGYTVVIKDARGREWFYHHMYRPPGVHVGQSVGIGQVLGGVGQTGAATGPHLHVGLQVRGQWVNPTRFIRRAFRRR